MLLEKNPKIVTTRQIATITVQVWKFCNIWKSGQTSQSLSLKLKENGQTFEESQYSEDYRKVWWIGSEEIFEMKVKFECLFIL